MNLILFEPHEVHEDLVSFTDQRADHIRNILRLGVGDTLRVGMVNGLAGKGQVLFLAKNRVDISVTLTTKLPAPANVDLILALPRPIMLKRILKQATVLGVRHFHLIRSAKVEKSFFHSPVLQPEKMRSFLLEGLTQAMDTRLPEVSVHHRFKPFVEDIIPQLDGSGLIAHPTAATGLPEAVAGMGTGKEQKVLLAIGPEGGWNEFELESFTRQGFTGFSMGKRILHVDTAVVALLAQLQLLREMNDG